MVTTSFPHLDGNPYQPRLPAKTLGPKVTFRGTALGPPDSYTKALVSAPGTRPVFRRPGGAQQRESNHRPDGKCAGMEPIASGILSWGAQVSTAHLRCRAPAPPPVTVSAAPMTKPSAKNLLSGSTGKAVSVARNAETNKTAVYMTVRSITFRHLFWALVHCPTLTAKNSQL